MCRNDKVSLPSYPHNFSIVILRKVESPRGYFFKYLEIHKFVNLFAI